MCTYIIIFIYVYIYNIYIEICPNLPIINPDMLIVNEYNLNSKLRLLYTLYII